MPSLYPVAALLTVLIAAHGWRKGSLSVSGALGALIAGYGTLANPLPTFGVLLLVFYLTGSRATKVKADVKAKLEREADSLSAGGGKKTGGKAVQSQHKAHAGGQRNAMQVLCNSATAFVAAVVFRLLYGGEVGVQTLASWGLPARAHYVWLDGKGFCSLSPTAGGGWSRILVLLALGHFSCCMGDTLASELGILSRSQPVLVLNPLRRVPPGTNGGISAFGTLMSLLGGLFIGATAALTTYLSNAACSSADASSLWARLWTQATGTTSHFSWLHLIVLGGLGGLLGSMLDSILGATFQRTYFSRETKQVLLGRLPAAAKQRSKQPSEWVVITGYDLLTNNQVNLISSVATSILIAYLGTNVLV
ncbi:hypothetical protein OC842_001686 [Tilletia horrida]|uniref:Integral membrane protein DUF92-domain-containing protein n=1 Tax=Tilletia horrida TaxID=155126 RepID=A0AAN6GHC4_9BASI|nr:hypothetical protein OC842_001686 [Tilletia horrida]